MELEKIATLLLSPAQAAVLQGTLAGKTYQQIADETGYSHEHLREVGAILWRQLSRRSRSKVCKKNLVELVR